MKITFSYSARTINYIGHWSERRNKNKRWNVIVHYVDMGNLHKGRDGCDLDSSLSKGNVITKNTQWGFSYAHPTSVYQPVFLTC